MGIGSLASGECRVLGLDADSNSANGYQCSGFKTAESAHTTQYFGVAVSASPLSVPGAGCGLPCWVCIDRIGREPSAQAGDEGLIGVC